jgi:hypothetical protein
MHLFEKPGQENTRQVFELVKRRCGELEIGTCLLASNTGKTAWIAREVLGDFRIVAVTHCTGFKKPNVQELSETERAKLEDAGIRTLTTAHVFGTIGRAVRVKLGGYQLDEIVANTLRIFGHGTKVAVEIALMAADAGLVRVGDPVVSVGGTGGGADAALVLLPANTHSFFDLKVREIICKPL